MECFAIQDKILPRLTSNVLKVISFKKIVANNIETQIRTDTIINFTALVNCRLKDVNLKIDDAGKFIYKIGAAEITGRQIDFSRHEGTHGGSIAKLSYSSKTKHAEIDSARVIPNYGKLEMGRHFKQQKSKSH